jgi:hypothetical protein
MTAQVMVPAVVAEEEELEQRSARADSTSSSDRSV